MANDERFNIYIGNRDSILYAWHRRASELRSGSVSTIIKFALRAYVKTGSFCCIGKVHASSNAKKVIPVPIYTGDAPELMEWLKKVSNSHVKKADVVKEILQRSIQIIPEEEEEWLPSWMDMVKMEQELGMGVLDELAPATQTPPHMVDVERTVSNHQFNQQPIRETRQTESQNAQQIEPGGANQAPAKNTVTEQKMNAKAHGKPRALALSGAHYKNKKN